MTTAYSESMEELRSLGLNGKIKDGMTMNVTWQLFLECLPSLDKNTWPIILSKERHGYEDLKQKLVITPSAQAASKGEQNNRQVDLNIFNPLSLEEESPWTQYFKDADLRKTIQQDVERTFPELPFFRDSHIQSIMTDILFIWSKLNTDVSYRQGMHEILAPVVYVVYQDANETDRLTTEKIYLEHDSWMLFQRIMKSAKIWFQLEAQNQVGGTSKAYSKFIKTPSEIPILKVCQRIQNDRLRVVDFDLYKRMTMLGIEPQLYAMRWIRLLFGREFTFHNLISLWTRFFAEDPNLGLVEWFCVAILRSLKEEILKSDFSTTLQLLMQFSNKNKNELEELQDIQIMVQDAIFCRQKYHDKILKLSSEKSPTHSSHTSSNRDYVPWKPVNKSLENNNSTGPSVSKKSVIGDSYEWYSTIQKQDNDLSTRVTHVSRKLNSTLKDYQIKEIQTELESIASQLKDRWKQSKSNIAQQTNIRSSNSSLSSSCSLDRLNQSLSTSLLNDSKSFDVQSNIPTNQTQSIFISGHPHSKPVSASKFMHLQPLSNTETLKSSLSSNTKKALLKGIPEPLGNLEVSVEEKPLSLKSTYNQHPLSNTD